MLHDSPPPQQRQEHHPLGLALQPCGQLPDFKLPNRKHRRLPYPSPGLLNASGIHQTTGPRRNRPWERETPPGNHSGRTRAHTPKSQEKPLPRPRPPIFYIQLWSEAGFQPPTERSSKASGARPAPPSKHVAAAATAGSAAANRLHIPRAAGRTSKSESHRYAVPPWHLELVETTFDIISAKLAQN